MKFSVALANLALMMLCLCPGSAVGQGGHIFVPTSSMARPADLGKRAHTNVQLFILDRPFGQLNPAAGKPPLSGYGYETPASIACLYHLVSTLVAGCDPNTVTTNPSGGAKAIGIVDAYDDPDALNDLKGFSSQFGLPAPTSSNFEVVYATGSKPAQDPTGGWELEESLDIQWAHAMAPNAKIYLVEAASNKNTDLFPAVAKASALVKAAGGGEVSMSWGGLEYSTEKDNDSYFSTSDVVYIAASGDGDRVEYPSASPYVISAGGSSISRNPTKLTFELQTGWTDAGGGPSAYEDRPSYQGAIESIVGSARGTPDISFNSNPNSGVWVKDSIPVDGQGGPGSWWIVGGTSAATQMLAGIINSAGRFATSTQTELTTIYDNLGTANFTDITQGTCYLYNGLFAGKGWDFCTGVGTPLGKKGE